MAEVPGGSLFGLEVLEGSLDLFWFQAEGAGNLSTGYVVFIGVKEEIEKFVVDAEVEFFVGDRKAVSVRTGGAVDDFVEVVIHRSVAPVALLNFRVW